MSFIQCCKEKDREREKIIADIKPKSINSKTFLIAVD